jgi:hypothetical protein
MNECTENLYKWNKHCSLWLSSSLSLSLSVNYVWLICRVSSCRNLKTSHWIQCLLVSWHNSRSSRSTHLMQVRRNCAHAVRILFRVSTVSEKVYISGGRLNQNKTSMLAREPKFESIYMWTMHILFWVLTQNSVCWTIKITCAPTFLFLQSCYRSVVYL